MKLTLASAQRDFGRIGNTVSKMPGSAFSTSTDHCHVGRKLAKVEGSVCFKCYAKRLEDFRPSAHKGWTDNYMKAKRLIAERPEQWAQAMAFQIKLIASGTGEPYHRWFAAGDLDSPAMFAAIVRVAELTPSIKHWLPTREAAFVKAYKGAIPANLVVRISSTMIGDKPIRGHAHTSTVHKHSAAHEGAECKARERDNTCGPCRACWDPAIANVSYPLH